MYALQSQMTLQICGVSSAKSVITVADTRHTHTWRAHRPHRSSTAHFLLSPPAIINWFALRLAFKLRFESSDLQSQSEQNYCLLRLPIQQSWTPALLNSKDERPQWVKCFKMMSKRHICGPAAPSKMFTHARERCRLADAHDIGSRGPPTIFNNGNSKNAQNSVHYG